MTYNRSWQRVNVNSPVNEKFTLWLRSANYSDYSIYRCIGYLQSPFVRSIVRDVAETDAITDIEDVNLAETIRRRISLQEQDLRLHHVYSSAVGRYIKFLQASTDW